MVRTTSDKQISSTFEGFFNEITVFKETFLQKNGIFTPLLNTLFAKTRHGVIYDFYVFRHG